MSDSPIFKDPNLAQQLRENGYVIVPFLEPEAVENLKRFFYELHPETPGGLYATAHSDDLAFRQQVSQGIRREFETPAQKWFTEVRHLGGTFIVKSPGKSVLEAHQDWNIVDESISRSFNVWMPLVDVNEQNGAVYILEKSHLLMESIRGPGFPSPFRDIMQEMWKLMVPLHMKAGEALVYDHRLIHASPSNQSEQDRLACVFGIVPENAEMLYYYCKDQKVQKYHSNVAFFFEQFPERGPGDLPLIGEVEYEFPVWDLDTLKSHYPDKIHLITPPPTPNRGFFARLFGG